MLNNVTAIIKTRRYDKLNIAISSLETYYSNYRTK